MGYVLAMRVWSGLLAALGADVCASSATATAPIVLHVVSASLFCVFGAFQFVAGFRRRMPRWHRVAGRLWTALGLVPAHPPAHPGTTAPHRLRSTTIPTAPSQPSTRSTPSSHPRAR